MCRDHSLEDSLELFNQICQFKGTRFAFLWRWLDASNFNPAISRFQPIIRFTNLPKKGIFGFIFPGFLYKLATSLKRQKQRSREEQQRGHHKTSMCTCTALGLQKQLIASPSAVLKLDFSFHLSQTPKSPFCAVPRLWPFLMLEVKQVALHKGNQLENTWEFS